MKQKEKLRNSKSQTDNQAARLAKQSLAIAGTVLLATSGTLVYADEVSTETTQPNTVSEDTAKEVTQDDVDSAKVVAETATQEVQAQENVVAEAENGVTSATQEVASVETKVAEAQSLANQATPEGIEQAQTTVSSAETAVAEAEQTLSDAKEADTAQSAVVESKEAQVQASQQKVDEKTVEVEQAQANLDKAQAILDGTGQAQVVKEAEEASKTLAEDTKSLAQAEESLAQAKKADAERQDNITKSQEKVATATKALETATNLLAEAEKVAEQATKDLKTAKDAYAVAENDVKGINTITVTPEYVSALRDYALNYFEKGDEAKAKLDGMAKDLQAKNVFKDNANDDKTVLDTNNLSESVRTELSLFASDLVNQIRKAFGTTPTSVTKGALQLADLTTDGYVADDWSFDQVIAVGHDAKAVNAAAKELGLKTTSTEAEAKGRQYYENMSTSSSSSATVTLAGAKREIYESIISFMFNGYEYLHAESISGLAIKDTRYLGVDLSSRSDVNSSHFLLVGDSDLTPESTFDKTVIANNSTTEKLQEAYQKAQDSLGKAEGANKKAQETLALKQSEKGTAEASAKTAQDYLEKALAIPVQTPLAEKAVTLAKEKVVASNGVYQKAQEALKTLKADVKQKQANVEAANAYLKAKEVELEALQQLLDADKKVLKQAKLAKSESTLKVKKAENTLSELKEKLAEANNDLKSLLNAPAVLKDAQASLKLSVARLEDKKSALATATSRLEELKAVEKEAINHYKVVLNAYQKVQEAKRQEQLEKERQEKISSNKTTVPVTYNTGKVLGGVALVSQAPQATPVTMPADKGVSQTEANLPSTGDSESALGLLGLVVTLMSTFGLARSKKQSH